MIYGIGTDICDVRRIRASLERHGERFAAARDPFAAMLEEIARRGLLYLDARPGGTLPKKEAMPPYRAIDGIVDSVPVRGAERSARGPC